MELSGGLNKLGGVGWSWVELGGDGWSWVHGLVIPNVKFKFEVRSGS